MSELYERAFQLIVSAGNAKSKAMLSAKAAREFHFEEAKKLLEEAKKEFADSHHIQTELLQAEAAGEQHAVPLIMIHAQDHLTMAMMAQENASEFLGLYQMIYELKQAK